MNEQAGTEASNQAQRRAQEKLTQEEARARAAEAYGSVARVLRRPAVGAGVAGAAVLAAGAFWGVTEAALAAVAVWAVFRTLRRKEKEAGTEAGSETAERGRTAA